MQIEQALFANDALYAAFNTRDLPAMTRLWTRVRTPVCIHPGWPARIGRDAVLDSWTGILTNPAQGPLQMWGARAVPVEGGAVLVVCYEGLGAARMVASNLFVEEEGEVRLALHQAGPCNDAPPPPPASDRVVQ